MSDQTKFALLLAFGFAATRVVLVLTGVRHIDFAEERYLIA